MRPILHPKLVNGRYGDPALYVDMQFEAQAVLFDLGDISLLPNRKIQRLEHVFVSHAHVDHFYGFDRLLRILVGRDKVRNLYGPMGFHRPGQLTSSRPIAGTWRTTMIAISSSSSPRSFLRSSSGRRHFA